MRAQQGQGHHVLQQILLFKTSPALGKKQPRCVTWSQVPDFSFLCCSKFLYIFENCFSFFSELRLSFWMLKDFPASLLYGVQAK